MSTRLRSWWIVPIVLVAAIGAYAIVKRAMRPTPRRFDQPYSSPTYAYGPSQHRVIVTGAEEGFIHTTSHGDMTSLAVWGNGPARGGGRRNVSPGYTSGRVTDDNHEAIFQWEARLSDQFEGVLTIAGREYSLSTGRLLLVSLSSDPPRVLQLRRDLNGMGPREIHNRFAEDTEVKGFFSQSSTR